MSATLVDATHDDVLHIARNLREWDRRELFATRWSDDPEDFATQAMQWSGFGFVCRRGNEPVAMIGAFPLWPGVWSPFAFGTDKWSTVAITLTKFARHAIIPGMESAGMHRAQVFSLEGHDDAQRWLERVFGAKRETTLPGFGRNGETFHLYSILRRDAPRQDDAEM